MRKAKLFCLDGNKLKKEEICFLRDFKIKMDDIMKITSVLEEGNEQSLGRLDPDEAERVLVI